MPSWSRRQEIRPSLMSRMKCLGNFRLLITFPAATPILSGSFSRPAAALAAMAPRSASVAASSSWRVRARLAASNGLRQAISRSPGKSGELISARSCSSNSDSCSGPSPAMSFLMAGWRRQVIHAIPSSFRRSLIRAEVIIPRSPTMITFCRENVPRTASTASGNAFGSAVLPANTRTATGRPSLSVSSPYSICGLPRKLRARTSPAEPATAPMVAGRVLSALVVAVSEIQRPLCVERDPGAVRLGLRVLAEVVLALVPGRGVPGRDGGEHHHRMAVAASAPEEAAALAADHLGPGADRFGFAARPVVEPRWRAGVAVLDGQGALAGNFRLLADGRLGVLDFGAVDRLPDGFPFFFGTLLRLMHQNRDLEEVEDELRSHGFLRDGVSIDLAELRAFLAPLAEPSRAESFRFSREWLRAEAMR